MGSHRSLAIAITAAWLSTACALSSSDPDPHTPGDPEVCGAGSTRLRGVCLRDCGGDPSQLDSEFAADLKPVANLCEAALAGRPLAAHSGGEPGSFTLISAASSAGAGQVELTLRFRTAKLADATLSDNKPCTLKAAGNWVLHDDLGVSPKGQYAHVIVRELGPDDPHISLASRAYVVSRACAVAQHELGPSAFETAIMLTEDPQRLIVGGHKSGLATGLFVGTQFIASGDRPVRRYGDDGVLTLSGTGHGAVWLLLLPAHSLIAGPFPVNGLRTEGEEWPYKFVVARGRGLIGDRPVAVGAVGEHWLFDIQHEDGRLYRTGKTTRFASQLISRVVPVEGSQLVLLEHEHGLLVVE